MKIIKGFSLIELMVVIAIVAVLAAVAVPAYNQHIAKAKISSWSQPLIQSTKDAALTYYQTKGVMPNGADIGISGAPWPNSIYTDAQTLLSADTTSTSGCGEILVIQVTNTSGNTNDIPIYKHYYLMGEKNGIMINACYETDTSYNESNAYTGAECNYQNSIDFMAACTL